jgi:hypothetical protein
MSPLDGYPSIWIGFDPRPAETQGFAVARGSIRRRLTVPIPINGVSLSTRHTRLYWRPMDRRNGQLWDVVSDAPMSTEFAISRFLVPHLARSKLLGAKGEWALFVDADVMARNNLCNLFKQADPSKVCMVVKHDHKPHSDIKMGGQVQTSYARKNWSSVVLWNCQHKGARHLTPELVNTKRGLWLHQFAWLDDNDIGELDPVWNHLVGEMPPNPDAKIAHFTAGVPAIPGYEQCEFADEWRHELERWAA